MYVIATDPGTITTIQGLGFSFQETRFVSALVDDTCGAFFFFSGGGGGTGTLDPVEAAAFLASVQPGCGGVRSESSSLDGGTSGVSRGKPTRQRQAGKG